MSTTRRRGMRRPDTWVRVGLAIVLLLGLLADSYAIYRIHVQRLGNALDFYPFWAGGREVVLNRHSPYDPAVMLSIQEAIYGRPALPGENQHGYAYPAYAPLVTLPFLLLPFPISASLWIASQQILAVAAVALTAQATGWRIGWGHMILLSLVAMTFRYSMITFVLGQTSIWVLCSLALALWAAGRKHNILAGLALAASAVKPQLIILPALSLLTSLPSRQRKRMFLALVGATVLLAGYSWILAGPWLADYWQQLQAYQGYSTTQFPVTAWTETWLPGPVSQVLNVVVIAALLGMLVVVLWRWRGSGQAAFPVALAVVVSQLVVPQTGSYNLVTLLLPAVVALHYLSSRHRRGHLLTLGGRVLVWADLLVVPWLLWPVVQSERGGPLDQIAVPALMLVVMLGVIVGTIGRERRATHRSNYRLRPNDRYEMMIRERSDSK